MTSSADPLGQLEQAAKIAMERMPEKMLPKVLETAITLFLNDRSNLGLARFSSQLMLDILVNRSIPASEKPFIMRQNLDSLWQMAQTKDYITYKNCILCLGNIYDQLFDLVAKTSDANLWNTMQKFKELVLANWKTCYPLNLSENDLSTHGKCMGVKLANVKFISKLIIVHTSGPGIGISGIPDKHPVIINKTVLEQEAKRTLDKLLTFLIEEPMMCAPWFTGILQCLSFIMSQRSLATTRIVSGLLKFNIDLKFQLDDEPVLRYRLAKRFVERSYRNLVQFGMKSQLIKNTGSMAQYRNKLAKISQTLFIIGEEAKAKGILNFDKEATEHKMSPSDKKRYFVPADTRENSSDISSNSSSNSTKSPSPMQITNPIQAQNRPTIQEQSVTSKSTDKLQGSQPQNVIQEVPFTSPVDLAELQTLQNYAFTKSTTKHPHFLNTSHVAVDDSYSAVFALMNQRCSGLDVSKLSQDTMAKLCMEALANTETNTFINGLSIVASRYTDLINKWLQSNSGSTANKRRRDELEIDEDIKPQIKRENDTELLNDETVDEYTLVDRSQTSFDTKRPKIESSEDISTEHQFSLGHQQLSKEEKLMHLERIVGHILSIPTLDDQSTQSQRSKDIGPLDKILLLDWSNKTSWVPLLTRLCSRGLSSNAEMKELATNAIFEYFCEDFQNRISLVLEWLSEEWYMEEMLTDGKDHSSYNKWSLKVLDFMIPKLEDSHRRLFIRMVSEMPLLSQEHIDKMKSLCLDPTRSTLGFQSLKFMLMFRPPVKPYIKEALVSMSITDSSLKAQCDSLLEKYYS